MQLAEKKTAFPSSLNHDCKNNSLLSLAIAIIIIVAWFISFVLLLKFNLAQIPLILIPVLVAIRTFIHTGIFIVIHDSIHGVVSHNRKINRFMGYLAAFLYAILPYQALAKNHHQHHSCPATAEDPDFYDRDPHNPWLWYASFMKDYQEGKQFWILFWGITVIFWSLFWLQVSLVNMFLFWIIPIILSSLQLFIFGIYLPHRPKTEGYSDRHRARSNDHSTFISFLACYHFGYHWEHHQYPYLPWYKLPQARKLQRQK